MIALQCVLTVFLASFGSQEDPFVSFYTTMRALEDVLLLPRGRFSVFFPQQGFLTVLALRRAFKHTEVLPRVPFNMFLTPKRAGKCVLTPNGALKHVFLLSKGLLACVLSLKMAF